MWMDRPTLGAEAALSLSHPMIPSPIQPPPTTNDNRQQLLFTQGSPHMRDNVVSVFGAAFAGTLAPIEVTLSAASSSSSADAAAASDAGEEGQEEGKKGAVVEEATTTRITGFVSKVGV